MTGAQPMGPQGAKVAIVGGRGFIGAAVTAHLAASGAVTTVVGRADEETFAGSSWDIVVNCDGNGRRYLAERDPLADFDASVRSVRRSVRDLRAGLYMYLSTVDVYDDVSSRLATREDATIHPERLAAYGFHKWLAERIVEQATPRHVILRVATAVGRAAVKGPVFDLIQRRPLFMSSASELALIDVGTIARAVERMMLATSEHKIVNVAPVDSISVNEIARLLDVGMPMIDPASQHIVHRYEVSNDRLSQLMPLPVCAEVVATIREGVTR